MFVAWLCSACCSVEFGTLSAFCRDVSMLYLQIVVLIGSAGVVSLVFSVVWLFLFVGGCVVHVLLCVVWLLSAC